MHAGHFRHVHVRGQAKLLVLRDEILVKLVVQVTGHQVRVRALGTAHARYREPSLPCHSVNPIDQLLSVRTVSHLFTDFPHLGRRKRVIEPGEQGPERQTHRDHPYKLERDEFPIDFPLPL